MRGQQVLVVLALAAVGRPALAEEQSQETRVSRQTLGDLGFGSSRRQRERSPRVGIPLVTRVDRVMLRGDLQLGFQPALLGPEVQGLDVELNGERLARFSRRELLDASTMRTVELDERLLSGKDLLVFALARTDDCAPVEPGTWQFIERGFLESISTPLPLPLDLATLPAPLLDDGFEKEPELVVVMPERSVGLLRAAALAVGGLTTRVDARPRFTVQDVLPEEHAVVLVPDRAMADELGLPFHGPPAVEMVDNPRRAHAKLLVISGAGADRVEEAARSLFVVGDLEGPLRKFKATPEPTVGQPPSQWLDASSPITIADIVGDALVHHGAEPGSLRATFRVSPALFGWPEPSFELKIDHRRRSAPDSPPLRVDVEINGWHTDTIISRATDGQARSQRIVVPRDLLRGYNELVFHVRPDVAGCITIEDPDAVFEVLGTTAVSLEGFVEHVELPNVELFAFDGFPFSRMGRLSETMVLLPPEPTAAEAETFLSAIAHIASITGDVPTGLEVETAARVPPRIDRDLLVIGRFDTHPIMRAWSRLSPLTGRGERLIPKRPSTSRLWRRLLRGDFDFGVVDRARQASQRGSDVAAMASFPSPLADKRTVVVLTANRDAAMPTVADFTGFAEARRRGGDLMIFAAPASEEAGPGADVTPYLSRHQLGTPASIGSLPPWTLVLWTASRNWLALFPILAVSIALLRFALARSVERRHRARVIAAPGGALP